MDNWLNEDRTRREKIDVFLKEQGWDVSDSEKVIPEVDTKQSDFVALKYKTVDETLLNDFESKYADYILLDSNNEPLAVIEAKRTSKDPIVGQKQAEEYADDIKKQTGKDVFIFLSNGYEIWFWNKPFENPRLVKGFHNRDSLQRIRFQNNVKKSLRQVPINKNIVDRDYQIEAIKRITEGIEKGKRKFLIVQATGTGKTRVAMALIDNLLKANRAQKILFLADRKALRDQAYDKGFKVYFPNEAKSKVYSAKLDKNARLYASTIQTFMECYQEFSPGDFDVIISDEAHRSIYNKWKDVFTYFDAVQIGLTATPADIIERDTFRFFECEGKSPTYLYTYDDAVLEGWLADYKVYTASTHHQIEGVKPEDVPKRIREELESEGIDEDELNFEGTDIEKKVIVKGTNEALVKEFMDNCLLDKTGTVPSKSIIFAMSKKHAKRIWEAFEKLYPEYKGKLAPNNSQNLAEDAKLRVKEIKLQLKERKLQEEKDQFEKEKLGVELSNYPIWKKEITEFEELLNSFAGKNLKERDIQKFLESKRWAFGLEYNILKPQKKVGSKGIADFYLMRPDGNVDFVELKKPTESVFDNKKRLTPVVAKAISQVVNYIETAINISGNERLKTIEQINAVKPRGFIIVGRDGNTTDQRELEILNAYLHGIEIWTYDKLLKKVKTSIDSIKKEEKAGRRANSERLITK